MTITTVASMEVANHYLDNIRSMFIACDVNAQGVYQKHWFGLREIERAALCKAAGLTEDHINMPLTDMSNRSKKQLLAAIKNMKRIVSLFNYANVQRMQGFN